MTRRVEVIDEDIVSKLNKKDVERMKLLWSKLANVITDGSPKLTGKNVGLLMSLTLHLQLKFNKNGCNFSVFVISICLHFLPQYFALLKDAVLNAEANKSGFTCTFVYLFICSFSI